MTEKYFSMTQFLKQPIWVFLFLTLTSLGCQLPDDEPFGRNDDPAPTCDGGTSCGQQITSICGNGQIDDPEECDDGNTETEVCAYGQTSCVVCDAFCNEVPGQTSFCGDGTVDSLNGEACDDGNNIDDDDCGNTCMPALCGNGQIDGSEECDDGNSTNNDACKNDCTLPQCGDDVVSTGETCDDGNAVTETCAYGLESCTVCDASCNTAAGATSFCGDGILDITEELCDEGGQNGSSTSNCRATCVLVSCGDGIVDDGESCDEGDDNGQGHCSTSCQEQPFVFKDLRPVGTAGSEPRALGELGNNLIVLAANSSFQVQLLAVNRENGKTTFLSNLGVLEPLDAYYLDIGAAAVTEAHLYLFTQLNDVTTVWKTDGTLAGTRAVKSFGSSDCYGVCYGSTALALPATAPQAEGIVLFNGANETNEEELWVTDGTALGTTPVLTTGDAAARPNHVDDLLLFDGLAYFAGFTEAHGEEIWFSDGTEEGTGMLEEIAAGDDGNINSLTLTPLGLFFRAWQSSIGHEPHWFNGDSIENLGNIRANGSSYPHSFVTLGSKACYAAEDDSNGEEVFCTDTSTYETTLLKDIAPEGEDSSPNTLVSTGDRLYFYAQEGWGENYSLWTSDGTPEGTARVFDDHPEIAEDNSSNRTMLALNNRVVFIANDADTGSPMLFQSQGTSLLTTKLSEATLAPNNTKKYWRIINGLLYFRADDVETGFELWSSDGTAEGTGLVLDLNQATNSSEPFSDVRRLGDQVVFTANYDGDEVGTELFVSDGTANGTVMLKDINPGAASSSPWFMGRLGDEWLFSAYEPVGGREIWKTDGTPEGTEQVAEIFPGSEVSSWLGNAIVFGNHIYFSGNDDSGKELWKTDGTFLGTSRVKDINPGTIGDSPRSSYPSNFGVFQNKLYFQADEDQSGDELWESDGTSDGTQLVADIRSGSSGSYPHHLRPTPSYLYFVARTDDPGEQLWAYDGDTAKQLTDINHSDTDPFVLTTYGDKIFFTIKTEDDGFELWISSGTPGTTYMLANLNPGPEDSFPVGLGVEGAALYFSAVTPDKGRELHVLNMESLTHNRIKDIWEGPESGLMYLDYPSINAFIKGNDGYWYFPAASENEGMELWRTDGTNAGTELFADLIPGGTSGFPTDMMNMDGYLFFRAFHPEYGFELWRYNFDSE